MKFKQSFIHRYHYHHLQKFLHNYKIDFEKTLNFIHRIHANRKILFVPYSANPMFSELLIIPEVLSEVHSYHTWRYFN